MFGMKKKESTPKGNGIIPSSTSHSLNSLVVGTVVEGSIKTESDIRIDGTLKGTLNCDSKVIIGPTGIIEGEVKCANAVIEGKFEGVLSVQGLLTIRETAHISGDVATDKLIIQSGAVFNVACKMGTASNGHLEPGKAKSIVTSGSKAGQKALAGN